jgi:hypothetical protein
MESTNLQSELEIALKNFLGKACWASVAGEGTGSTFSLNFGRKILRERPLKNPFLPNDVKRFSSEYSLYVQFASWRLDDIDQVICTSTDSNENDGVMVNGLTRLMGCIVTETKLSKPGQDLFMKFDNKYQLTVFSCWSNEAEPATNYSVSTPTATFSVESRSEILVESKN